MIVVVIYGSVLLFMGHIQLANKPCTSITHSHFHACAVYYVLEGYCYALVPSSGLTMQ